MNGATPSSAWAEAQIEKLRERLLDLTNRNPLLNFRHSAATARQIRVIDERLSFLFRALANGKRFIVRGIVDVPGDRNSRPPVAEVARRLGLNTDYELRAGGAEPMVPHHADDVIQTLDYELDVERKADRIRQVHRRDQDFPIP